MFSRHFQSSLYTSNINEQPFVRLWAGGFLEKKGPTPCFVGFHQFPPEVPPEVFFVFFAAGWVN